MNELVDLINQITLIFAWPFLSFLAFFVVIVICMCCVAIALKLWSLNLWLAHTVWQQDVCDKHRELVGDAKTKGWYGPKVISQTTVIDNVLYNGNHGRQCVVTFVGSYSIPEEFRNGLLTGTDVSLAPRDQSPICATEWEHDQYLDSIVHVDGEHQLEGSSWPLIAATIQSVTIFVSYGKPKDAIIVLDD